MSFAGLSMPSRHDEDLKTRDKQDSSSGSNAPLVNTSNQQQRTREAVSRSAVDRLRHPLPSDPKSKKTARATEPTASDINPWAIDRQAPAESQENVVPPSHSTEGPDLPFEKLVTPFYVRPFSALDNKADKAPPKDKPSAIPVPVASPVPAASRRTSGQYRSTSSSYPSQGMRSPVLVDSPPATARKRNFFSIGRYSKPNQRLSALFSPASSTEAVHDSTEGYRQPLEAVNDDEVGSLASSANVVPPSLEEEADNVQAVERQVEQESEAAAPRIDAAVNKRGLSDKEDININSNNPDASESTDTIVKSSGDEGAQLLNGTASKSEVLELGLNLATTTDESEVDGTAGQPRIPSRRSSDNVGAPAPVRGRPSKAESPNRLPVPVTMSRTSTQQNRQLSGVQNEALSVAAGRKPTAAIRITRRVRGVKFGKWLTKRLRRVRHPRRQKQQAFVGQELTEENLRRIDNAGVAVPEENLRRIDNADVTDMMRPEKATRFADGKLRKKKNHKRKKGSADAARGKHAGLLRKRGDTGKTKDAAALGEMDGVGERDGKMNGDIVMLPNGRVMSPGKTAAAKNDTIGRRAAAWFKEQTGSVRDSVDLTRFLLREMKCEMKSAA